MDYVQSRAPRQCRASLVPVQILNVFQVDVRSRAPRQYRKSLIPVQNLQCCTQAKQKAVELREGLGFRI